MLDSVTFVDLVALMRIQPDSTVEKFGGLINSSFFDASNILGSLKQKKLVDFVTQFPSQSAITVTEQGKQLIAEAQQKATAPLDQLDMAILKQLESGKRALADVAGGVNVTQKDLATHLYKLSNQQFMSYELRNGNMNMMLTESGFMRVKEGIAQTDAASTTALQQETAQQAQPQQAAAQSAQPGTTAKTPEELKSLEAKIMRARKLRGIATIAILIIIIIILLMLFFALK
ncbi:MAG: hypothetical protein ACREBH_02880 [Candidatus Micrarchaeaceae archaeon]